MSRACACECVRACACTSMRVDAWMRVSVCVRSSRVRASACEYERTPRVRDCRCEHARGERSDSLSASFAFSSGSLAGCCAWGVKTIACLPSKQAVPRVAPEAECVRDRSLNSLHAGDDVVVDHDLPRRARAHIAACLRLTTITTAVVEGPFLRDSVQRRSQARLDRIHAAIKRRARIARPSSQQRTPAFALRHPHRSRCRDTSSRAFCF
eukprot:6211787-Pleurochrysis_carterae.AAC.1